MQITKFLCAALCAQTLVSCSSDDPALAPVVLGSSCNAVQVSENITTATTWHSGSVYVIGQDISVSAPLTIESGTVIKSGGGRIMTLAGGRITALGTANAPIIFTSLADDSCCGDTNNDGTATRAAKGDWTGIYLNGGEGHRFQHCQILYAGKDRGGYCNAVLVSAAGNVFEFDYCTIAHTATSASASAYAFYGGFHMQDNGISRFTNNVLYDNDRPILCDSNYTLSTTNSFHNPADASQTNKRNGIFLFDTAKNNWVTHWDIDEVPYVVSDFNQGGLNHMLLVGANVIVKFTKPTAGISFQATRPVEAHASVILTSYKDDAHGGDTNGDGNATSPAAGDWDGVFHSDPNEYLSGDHIFYDSH